MKTVLETTTVPRVRVLYRLAVCLAAVSAAFCLLFCGIIAYSYFGNTNSGNTVSGSQNSGVQNASVRNPSDPSYRKPAEDAFNRLPTDQAALFDVRQQLAKNRQDETIKAQIRELDLRLRENYFNRRTAIQRTVPFLLLSAILFFAAMRTIDVLKRQIPDPNAGTNASRSAANTAGSWRFAVVLAWFMLFGGLALGLTLMPVSPTEQIILAQAAAALEKQQPAASGDREPATASPIAGTQSPALEPLTEEILAKHWVSFRNFDGNGVGFAEKPPLQWNGKTGENIVWKTEVPLPGKSSPVIWGDKLFVTGADETTQKIFCCNLEDGKLLWEADVTKQIDGVEVSEDTGFAAPTAVVDGQHVFAMFANGELVAVDFTGKLVWRKSFGKPENFYGFASSPALCFDKLIVQFDNGDGSDGTSKIVALELATGNVIWETARAEMPNSWASPMVKKIGEKYQIITCGNPFVIAYNPDDGKELWRCKCLEADVGPSPVTLGNTVLIANQSPRTTAIDATGSGDVTATHVLWQGVNALPDTVSPLAAEEYFMTLDSYGFLTGYDPKVIDDRKRARFWELSISDTASVYSSPIRVGHYIYVFDKSEDEPKAFVIDLSKLALDAERKLTEESAAAMVIATNVMPEPCESSPAMLNNRLYIRGAKTVYCIK